MHEIQSPDPLDKALWARLGAAIGERIGIYFGPGREADLQRGLVAVAASLGKPDGDACARWLLAAPWPNDICALLARCLTIGETYFFRDRGSFDVLRGRILPDVLQARARAGDRRLRVWSAGCSTGEEAYSIAMLLVDLIPDIARWHIDILATDIHAEALLKAEDAVYGEWSFRDVDSALKQRFFIADGAQRLRVLPAIRQMVRFATHNLAEDRFPGPASGEAPIDLLLCRNVLLYFAPPKVLAVLDRMANAIGTQGWLVLGPAEIPAVPVPGLHAVHFGNAIFHRRQAPGDLVAPSLRVARRRGAAPFIPVTSTGNAAPRRERRTGGANAAPVPRPEHARSRPNALPDTPDALARQARMLADRGELDQAAACCELLLEHDPLHIEACCLLAEIFQQQGRLDSAEQALRRVLYSQPDNVMVHFALGNLHRRQGRPREAVQHMDIVLDLINAHAPDELLPGFEGLTAGRLAEIIRAGSHGAVAVST